MTKVLTNAWTTIGQYDNGRFHLKYQMWANEPDVANNRTYLWRRLLFSVDQYGQLSAVNHEYSGTGMTTESGGAVSFTAGDTVLLASEGYVTHASDGTWSQTVTGRMQLGGVYDWSCSGTAELETIPRTSKPSVSTIQTNIGNNVVIYTNRASTSFTHDITAVFGSSSTVHSIAKNVSDSTTFKSADYVSAVVSAQSSGKTRIVFTVTTKHGSTIIGSEVCTLNIVINPSVPTVNNSTVEIGNTVTVSTNRINTTSARTHTIQYKIGDGSYTTLQSGVTTSTTFNTLNYVQALVNSASSNKTTVTFRCYTYVNGTSIGNKTVSTTVTLSPSVPTVNNSTVEIGNTVTVSTNRISTTSARTHTIQYKIGDGSYTTLQSGVTTSTTFNTLNYVQALVNSASSNKTTVTFRCYTYVNGTSIGNKTVSTTVTLSPSVPTVTPSTFTMGDTINIKTNRIATNRTHTLYVVINGTSTRVSSSTGSTTTGGDYPTSESSTIGGAVIKAAGTTKKFVSGTFKLETILKDVVIGSKSVSFIANVDTETYKPKITWGTRSDRNTTVAQYHASTAMINGLSDLRQVITFGTTSAYEELASATITLGSVKRTLSASDMRSAYNFDVDNVSANKITVSVTDKRGTTITESKTFNLVGYAPPTLSKSSVTRINMTGDTARYELSGIGYAGTYTGSKSLTNSIKVSYRIRAVGTSYPSNFTSLGTASLSGSGSVPWRLSAQFTDLFDYSKQYDIQFRIEDGFGELTRIIKALRLYNGIPVYGWGQTHFDVYGKFHIHDRADPSQRWVLPDGLDAIMYSQGSKNQLQCIAEETTFRGIEYKFDVWNRVTCNGTASDGNSYILYGWFTCQRVGTYTLSGCPVGGEGSLYYLQAQDSNSTALCNDYGSGATFSAVYGQKIKVYIIIQEGQTITDVKFAPMIRYSALASSAYSPFAPVFSQLPNFALMIKGTISNANSATDLGIYSVTSGTGTPSTSGLLVTLSPYLWADTSTLRWQVFFTSTPAMYIRYRNSSGTWTSWRQVTTEAV